MGKVFPVTLGISSIAIFILGIICYFDLMTQGYAYESVIISSLYIVGSLFVMGLGIHEWRDDNLNKGDKK